MNIFKSNLLGLYKKYGPEKKLQGITIFYLEVSLAGYTHNTVIIIPFHP